MTQTNANRVLITEIKSFVFKFKNHGVPTQRIQLIKNEIQKLSHAWIEKSIINNPPWLSKEELEPFNLKATDFGYCSYVKLQEYQRSNGTNSIGFIAPTKYECIEFSLIALYWELIDKLKKNIPNTIIKSYLKPVILEIATEEINKDKNPALLKLYLDGSPFYQYVLNL